MPRKFNLTAENVSENLVLFMQRYAYNQKQVARIIDIPASRLSIRLKMNNWHPDEIRALNNKLTKQRGVVL